MSVRVEGGGGAVAPTVIPTIHHWALLGTYEALIAEASHVFNFPAVDFSNDSMLVLVVDGSATAALSLQLRINTDATGNYYTDGYRIRNAVETLIDLNLQNQAELANSAILTGGGSNFHGTAYILLSATVATDATVIISQFAGDGAEQRVRGLFNVGSASITDVEVRTSVSTWLIGTRMTLYRVQRNPYQNVPA